MKVRQAIFALHFIDTKLDFSEGMVFVILKIGKRDFENSAFQGVIGILQTCGAIHKSLSNAAITLARLLVVS